MWMSCLRKKSGSMPYRSAFARVQVSAAVMDSCITSPRCPVMVNCLPPRMRVASMKMMSPPTGVQTSPTASPGLFARDGGDLALQVAHARFPRKAVNDFAQPLVGEVNLLAHVQAVFLGLLRDQLFVRDVQLF